MDEALYSAHSVEMWVELEGNVSEDSPAQVHRDLELLTVHFSTDSLHFVRIFIQQEFALTEIRPFLWALKNLPTNLACDKMDGAWATFLMVLYNH